MITLFVSEMIGIKLFFCALVVVVSQATLITFPPDFKFGAATAAYQVEGAWNETDKAVSIWDDITHLRKDKIVDGSNGDMACDSYHQWERDIQMAQELGLDYYRFSISWPRICPNAFCNKISEAGAAYYNKLINGLLARGIQPVVTLYHWDLPQRFQNYGGWANPLLVDWFATYARKVFDLYADRVKTWITINEPFMVCDGAYSGIMAPMLKDAQFGGYLCTKNVLLAHAKAWRVYDEEYRPKYHGKIALSNYAVWFQPHSPGDQGLTDLALEFLIGRYSHPIFSSEGGWPPALEKLIAKNSAREGHTKSRLPAFTEEEKKLVRGTFDFYGINYYTSREVRPAKPGEVLDTFFLRGLKELEAGVEANPAWKDTALDWFKQNAQGFRSVLKWMKQQYGDIPFLIMENGFPTEDHILNDDERVQYIKDHLTQVYLAMEEDGVNIKSYTIWSLMDNFEWGLGYQSKFGLYEVNFTDPQRTRIARSSAHYYADVIKTHILDSDSIQLPERNIFNVTWLVIALGLVVLLFIIGFIYVKNRGRKEKEHYDYGSVALNEEGVKQVYS